MRKFFIQLFTFLFISLIVTLWLGYKLADSRDLSEYFPAERWNDFYEQPDNSIDLLFAGSSYCYRSCIPCLFDSALNVNSFNLGSSNQTPMTTYFVLKEVFRHQKPKNVIVESCYNTFSVNDNYLSGIHNIDFIRSIDIKAEMLLTHFNLSEITEYLVPIYRFNNYKTWLIKGEKKKIFHNVGEGISSKYYCKGYVASFKNSKYKSINTNYNARSIDFQFNNIQIKYLKKIKSLCDENNANLIWYVHAINPAIHKLITNYDEIHKTYKKIALSNDITLIDFNVRNISLSNNDFYDSNHLTHNGAKKFSSVFINNIKTRNMAFNNK